MTPPLGESGLLALIEQAAADRRFSPNTLEAYRRTWVKFFSHCIAADLSVPDLGREKARELYADLAGARSPSHHLQVKAALAFVYKVLDRPNPFDGVVAPKFDIEKIEMKYLASAQVGLVLGALREDENAYYGRMAATLASALFLTATRFHEWATLTRDRLVWAGSGVSSGALEGYQSILRGASTSLVVRFRTKGGRFSDTKVSGGFARMIAEWLEFVDAWKGVRLRSGGIEFAGSQFVFPGRDGKPFTNEAFNLRLKAACKKVGVPVITAHGLRHAAATALLNEKHVNIKDVQEMLRHKDLATTARYLHVDHAKLAGMVQDLESMVG